MKHKKTPAPRRAGTDDDTQNALEQLAWLREHRPRAYDQLMISLARLVAIARSYDD